MLIVEVRYIYLQIPCHICADWHIGPSWDIREINDLLHEGRHLDFSSLSMSETSASVEVVIDFKSTHLQHLEFIVPKFTTLKNLSWMLTFDFFVRKRLI